jgi:hypothetical protein
MTRKDDPFKSGLAMLGFQHASTREGFSNSIEPLPMDEFETDEDAAAVKAKPSPQSAVRLFAVYVATLLAL